MKISKYGFKIIFLIFLIIIFFRTDIRGEDIGYNFLMNSFVKIEKGDENLKSALSVYLPDNKIQSFFSDFYGANEYCTKIGIGYMTLNGKAVFCLNPGLSADGYKYWGKWSSDQPFSYFLNGDLYAHSNNILVNPDPNGDKITLDTYVQLVTQNVVSYAGIYNNGGNIDTDRYFAAQLILWRCMKRLNDSPNRLLYYHEDDVDQGKVLYDENLVKVTAKLMLGDLYDEYTESFIDTCFNNILNLDDNIRPGKSNTPYGAKDVIKADYYYYPGSGLGGRDENYQFLVGWHIDPPGGGGGGRRWRWHPRILYCYC